MTLRKTTSLTVLVSFVCLSWTGIILYIGPHGRVAYWSDWRFWGLTLSQWQDIHINLSLLFLLVCLLHVYYNWKVIVSYLKDRLRRIKVFTWDFNVALLLTALIVGGTCLQAPPIQWVLDLSASIKESASKRYGEPPYGHAELSSVKTLVSRMGLDLIGSLEALKKAGIRFENERQSLQEIAHLNGMTPQQVFLAMKAGRFKQDGRDSLPEQPMPGLGKRALADICQEYGLDPEGVLHDLARENIKATPDMTLKAVAEQNGLNPVDVYEVIRKGAGSR